MAMTFCCLNLTVLAQNISLKMSDVTVKEAIEGLKEKSGYSFVFFSGELDTKKKVSVSAENSSIEAVVNQILFGQNVSYELDGKNIIIKQVRYDRQQNNKTKKTVTGIIKDNMGLPVIGANVIEKGTTNGTVTDIDGKYILQVSEGSTLTISYIGYVDKEVRIGKEATVNIQLTEDMQALDEVVVVGYGTQKKVNLTGAVSTLKMEEVVGNRPVTDVSSALQGVVPGLQITAGNAHPGGETKWNIRGTNSINGGSPLILVDNMPMDIDMVDPNDIETVNILKDAAASAIYGARAAFGVVLITTKQAKKGDKLN